MKPQIVRPLGEWIGLVVYSVLVVIAFGCAIVGWTAAALILAFVGFTGLFDEVGRRVFYDRAESREAPSQAPQP